jgi:hypothetical protein
MAAAPLVASVSLMFVRPLVRWCVHLRGRAACGRSAGWTGAPEAGTGVLDSRAAGAVGVRSPATCSSPVGRGMPVAFVGVRLPRR